MRWSQAEVDAHNAKMGKTLIDIINRTPIDDLISDLSYRPNSQEEGLNALERRYLSHLRAFKHPWLGIQALKFRLAHNTHYTPDFVFLNALGKLEAHETKGFMRDDAAVKIKVASRLFPFVEFVLVTWKHEAWDFQHIQP